MDDASASAKPVLGIVDFAAIDRGLHEARRTVRQFWNWANLCQCGNPEWVLRVLGMALSAHEAPGSGSPRNWELIDALYADPLGRFVMYALDGWGLTEHGTEIRGAWLTPGGIRLRAALALADPDTVFDEDWWDVEQVLNPNPAGISEGEWKP